MRNERGWTTTYWDQRQKAREQVDRYRYVGALVTKDGHWEVWVRLGWYRTLGDIQSEFFYHAHLATLERYKKYSKVRRMVTHSRSVNICEEE